MEFTGTYFYKLLQDPLVFVISSGWNFASGISLCLQESQGRPCRVLVQCYWYAPQILPDILEFKKNAGPETRHLILTYLCNSQEDTDLLMRNGIDALHIHHNAFIDERIYLPLEGCEKKFNAVHNANTSVTKFKRHHLAWGVKRIAVITYAVEHIESNEELSGYEDLAFVNAGPSGKIELLNAHEVTKIVNASRCGLILSELEGANFASTEYLLCGIPIVSTPSSGGRDQFFDPRHVKIVEPRREEVEKAVEQWCEDAPPAEEIRESALSKSRMHRRRMLHWLSAISGRDLFATADQNLWSNLFTDKLRIWVNVPAYKIPESQDPTKSFN